MELICNVWYTVWKFGHVGLEGAIAGTAIGPAVVENDIIVALG